MTRSHSGGFKINPGFAVDLSNYSGKDLSRLQLRLAAIPCNKDVWACPDLRSGSITRPKTAA
jgi:hypothetical protein